MIKTIGICAAFLAGATGAQAACVTAADLETGIRVEADDATYEEFRTFSDDVISAEFFEDGAVTSRTLLLHGVYMVEWLGYSDGGPAPDQRDTYSFPIPRDQMPLPSPGEVFEVNAVALRSSELEPELQRYSFGAEQQLELSGCTYRMVPFTVTYPDDTEVWIEYLNYLPAVGLALYVGNQDAEGLTQFPPIKIERIE